MTTTLYFQRDGLTAEYRQGLLTPPPDDQQSLITADDSGDHEDETDILVELERAVRVGNLDKVQQIFNMNQTARFDAGRLSELLIEVLDRGNTSLAAYLLSQEAPFETVHVEWAIARNLTSLLDAFLQRGWNINAPSSQGLPLLAKVLDKFDLIQWFLDHGANPNAQSLSAVTPLSVAVAHYSYEHVYLLLENGGSVDRGQLLHFAVCRQDDEGLQITKLLLDHDADTSALMCEDNPTSFQLHKSSGLGTPLHYAASSSSPQMVGLLLEYGADPLQTNTLGKTAIDVANDVNKMVIDEFMRELQLHTSKPEASKAPTNRRTLSVSDMCN